MTTDRELRDAYGRILDLQARRGREGCPPPEAILTLAEQGGDETARLRTLDHVMACPPCREELELFRAVGEGRPPGGKTRRASRFPIPRSFAWAAGLVLALGAGSLWWSAQQGDHGRVVRGGDAEVALLTPEPEGRLESETTFVWRPVAGAFEYRLEILDGGGEVVFSATTRDTILAARDLPALDGAEMGWWVSARMADGTTRRSEIRALEVGR